MLDINYFFRDRSEKFGFLADDTLFVGLNLVASSVHDPAEWADRSADDLAWIQDRFAQYGATANNAVVFAGPYERAFGPRPSLDRGSSTTNQRSCGFGPRIRD